MEIVFKKVIPTESQIEQLYSFLEKRKSSISHRKTPSKVDHTKFVEKHPYLGWYLAYKGDDIICSVYVQSDNSIGVNLLEGFEDCFPDIVKFIKKKHKHLPPIKSIRRNTFLVNVSSQNIKLLKYLNDLNFEEIQRSFLV